MSYKLSKSKVMSGRQCEKRLWLEVHQPKLAEIPAETQRRFDAGNEVNDAARALHPDGHLIGFDGGIGGAIAETRETMRARPDGCVFEATFAHDDVAVRIDILKKDVDGYRLIEVKSATSVKDQYYPDCAVQAWVLEGNALRLTRVELAHINNKFIYRGDGDYAGLFYYADVSDDIAAHKNEMPQQARDFQKMLSGAQPDIDIGAHCHEPYDCPFINHCSGDREVAKYPVACLPGHKRAIMENAMRESIGDIRDIPPGWPLNEKQKWVRELTIRGESELKADAKKIIDACDWPRYYMDFETVQFAVPRWKNTRPYEQLPFQWSCHVETAPGEFAHEEFLDTAGDAPMRVFAETLLRALGTRGAVFVYSGFEERALNAVAARFPDLAAPIKKVIARIVDLHALTKKNYYHPDMRGSWSLKSVLPCIAPHLSYDGLGEVQDGNAAAAAYQEMISAGADASRANKLAADLRDYCKRDTEALVELAKFLRGAREK